MPSAEVSGQHVRRSDGLLRKADCKILIHPFLFVHPMALLKSVILLALVAFNLFTVGHGWRLDKASCDKHPIKDRLLKALPKALELVNDAIESNKANEEETVTIRKMLFPDLPFFKVKEVQGALEKIQKAMTTNSGREAGVKDMRDPIIFCDQSRWEKVPSAKPGEPDAYRNKVTKKFDPNPNGLLARCMNEKSMTGYSSRFEGEDAEDSQDFIQLCPWWLKWLEKDDFQKDINKWDDKKWAEWNMPEYDFKQGEEGYVDSVYAFERTLIHEFSHTANGGRTVDLKGPDGTQQYGWLKCADPPRGFDMWTNADTLALFCVASNLANHKMQRPLQNGNLERMCPGKGKKYHAKCEVM
ncbi:hypothetical protein BDW42DRAFT_190714 [Aspergillus taichungensis]|uniref:Lysine-specific metallo-endopeptidase domain-containing protein n=1 Tax=Aspergillus taichungensis TaxID=482145 RepID=A0A2J5I775_9EURO|nr:hypothetical protein BDW42DRAFT_190714 [Aspergillus taichungensis]